jgi:ketosteroid isomerase-like protein
VPDGSLGDAYAALGRGDSGPLLALLGPHFEWIEPDLPGYPLSGTHRGREGFGGVLDRLDALFDELAVGVDEVVETGDRLVATGTIHGRPAGADADWTLPFAHVWELEGGEPLRARAYFDRSRLTLAASRRRLADLADDLLEQAAEIRRQWARLGDALRASGLEAPEEGDEPLESAAVATTGSASMRLAAVDMADEGATREEVDAFLRDEHGLDDTVSILDEVFGPAASSPEHGIDEHAAALEARRLSRLFARNRD